MHAFSPHIEGNSSNPTSQNSILGSHKLHGPLLCSHQPDHKGPADTLPKHNSLIQRNITLPLSPFPGPPFFSSQQTTQLFVPTKRMEDEEFISQFANLSAGTGSVQPVDIPINTVTTRDWKLCALVRVVTDKTVTDPGFSTLMRRIWGVHTSTEISAITRNIFFTTFTSTAELERIMHKGVWTYRGDAVVMKRLGGPADLSTPTVSEMEVWTQLHKLPFQALSEGVLLLASQIGKLFSRPTELFQGGNTYHRVKVRLPVDQALKDIVQMNHPILGICTTYPSYERLNRVCLYCAKLGHDMDNCPDKLRMERLRLDSRYCNRPEMQGPIGPRIGPWISDPSLIPDLPQTGPSQDIPPTDISETHINALPGVLLINAPPKQITSPPDPIAPYSQAQLHTKSDTFMSTVYPGPEINRKGRSPTHSRSHHHSTPYQRPPSSVQPYGPDLP